MKVCSFVIPGRAVPAVRMTQRSKYTRQAQRYLAYKRAVAWIARRKYRGPAIKENVAIELNVYLNGGVQGDLDNYFKSIADSLNKIVYEDDRQIKEMHARKLDCENKENERVEVVVYKI